MQRSLEEEDYQGQHERMRTWGIVMSVEEWRKCVVRGTGCMSPIGNLVGFFVENG